MEKIKYIIILTGILVFTVSCSTSEPAPAPATPPSTDPGIVQSQQQPPIATGDYQGPPSIYNGDPILVSTALKLSNKLTQFEQDAFSRTIFMNPNNENAFGQDLIESSYMRNYFSQVRAYGQTNSNYVIEMNVFRIYDIRTLNRVLYEKKVTFQFSLIFQGFNKDNPEALPVAGSTYVISQQPITLSDNKGETPKNFYLRALNEYLNRLIQLGYIKTEAQLGNQSGRIQQ